MRRRDRSNEGFASACATLERAMRRLANEMTIHKTGRPRRGGRRERETGTTTERRSTPSLSSSLSSLSSLSSISSISSNVRETRVVDESESVDSGTEAAESTRGRRDEEKDERDVVRRLEMKEMREIGIDCGDASTRARGSNAEEIERRVSRRRRRRRERRGGARRFGARDCGFETVCEESVDGTRSIVGDEQRFTRGVAQESCRNERVEIEDASKDAADDDDEHTNRGGETVRSSVDRARIDRVVHERARDV